MSERTSKLSGWVPQGKPMEGPELERSRELIRSVIFAKFFEKKASLVLIPYIVWVSIALALNYSVLVLNHA